MKKLSALASTAIVAVFFFVVVLSLQSRGMASRAYGSAFRVAGPGLPVQVFETAAEVHEFWQSRALRGRVVLHLGRYLHFLEVDESDVFEEADRYNVKAEGLVGIYGRRAGNENYLWVALQGGIAREIHYVMPPVDFSKRQEAVQGLRAVEVTKDTIKTHYFGSRRVITGALPKLDEPVVLNVDASYFEAREPEQALSEFKASGLRADVVTLCLAMDNPDVTPGARERLREFASLLKGG